MSVSPGPTSRTPLLAASRDASPLPPRARSSSVRPIGWRRRKPTPPIVVFPALITVTLFVLVAFAAWNVSSLGQCYVEPLCRIMGAGQENKEDVWWRNVGAHAPVRSVGSGGGARGLPRGCVVDQVSVLHRHTARFPTTSAGDQLRTALDKIANRTVSLPRRHPELVFLPKADFMMAGWKFDQLTDQGRKAAWRSGRDIHAIYKQIIDHGEPSYTRSAGGERVVESSAYWLQGFRGEPFKLKRMDQLPKVDLIIPEGPTVNNTLSVKNCPGFANQDPPPGALEMSELYPLLQPGVSRLNTLLHPQPPLNAEDVLNLADMCAFDSQAEGEEWAAWSRWCGIFDRDEWEVLGYANEVMRWYEVGEGSIYGKTMGAGYVNELIARLTDTAPEDSTTTNRTLDSDEASFPRGGKRLFVDFSHDNEMIEIITALGVMKQKRPLSTSSLQAKRTFRLSNIIPFGSRIIFERVSCDLGKWEPDPNAGDGEGDPNRDTDGRKDYLRILINDAIHPVDHLACQQSNFAEHGLCEVASFVESQLFSTTDVDWGLCYNSTGKKDNA